MDRLVPCYKKFNKLPLGICQNFTVRYRFFFILKGYAATWFFCYIFVRFYLSFFNIMQMNQRDVQILNAIKKD